MRELRYRAVAAELRRQLQAGEIPAGRLLPSEADLSRRYDVSRVTVRKALDVLRAEGLVDSRQGFGWFAAGPTLRQHLGRLATLESQLAASGLTPGRRVLSFGFLAAPDRVAELMGVAPGAEVLEVRRLNLSDGVPFARVTVWVPARLGSSLSRDDAERTTFHELLGVALGGATQTIGAAAADAVDAAALGVPAGSPVLRCERVTRSVTGEVVLVSEHVFPAHRTEFVVDLPTTEASIAPPGLRLVE